MGELCWSASSFRHLFNLCQNADWEVDGKFNLIMVPRDLD